MPLLELDSLFLAFLKFTPFQCFGELFVVALEIGLEFHLLLAQRWVVGFVHELD